MNKQRTYWACRRGMLELDLMLMAFFTHEFDKLTANDQDLFAKLLAETDQCLYDWLLSKAQVPPKVYATLIEKICAV